MSKNFFNGGSKGVRGQKYQRERSKRFLNLYEKTEKNLEYTYSGNDDDYSSLGKDEVITLNFN